MEPPRVLEAAFLGVAERFLGEADFLAAGVEDLRVLAGDSEASGEAAAAVFLAEARAGGANFLAAAVETLAMAATAGAEPARARETEVERISPVRRSIQ